ncbi:VOC family protein [Aureibacillus halotolerans]|uniref:VOC domain-containing protein n=1 Tax=Aureibacillus halotolerans TaxID=1508390 RepID=A0A4R6UCA1_9BACI|nr:VOC family protein [Aureibacillus halotolerans]TDQ42629.1 hypothetical protein EV213_10157 [Aureibacillus halotolerans]
MSTLTAGQIFVNLPVKDIKRTTTFFTALGFEFNPQFSNENTGCMVISEHIFVMLLEEARFKDFTKKDIVDASKGTEAILCLSATSREAVDELVNKAVAAGATTPNEVQDHGFMYGWGFEDLDGHLWELMYMDPSAFE